MTGISKRFGPVQALADVTFCARIATVHALCGENGAGKSTLMKVLAGVHRPDAGQIELQGRPCRFDTPAQALQAGISMIYQELDLAEDLTVAESIFLGAEPRGPLPFTLSSRAMVSQTMALASEYGFSVRPQARISQLSMGDSQIVELLKALRRRASIIVMDEPTSSLTQAESLRLFEVVRQLRARDLTIIYISHRLEEVVDLADDISVLRDGKVVHSAQAAHLDIPQIIRHMVGRELTDIYPPKNREAGSLPANQRLIAQERRPTIPPLPFGRGEGRGEGSSPGGQASSPTQAGLPSRSAAKAGPSQFKVQGPSSSAACPTLQVQNLSTSEGIEQISFDVQPGEIVGMAGLMGSGRTEVARALFGLVRRTSGDLLLDGDPVALRSPREAIAQGVALLTEDRKRTGLCLNLPCAWNISLPNLPKLGMAWFLAPAHEANTAAQAAARVNVRWASPLSPANSLSGGNQQKLLIARWLLAQARLLIFDEPTRGIDIGAKREVYALLRSLAAEGKAILLISSELPELFGLSDRILVMRRGRLAGTFPTNQTTPDQVMQLAAVES